MNESPESGDDEENHRIFSLLFTAPDGNPRYGMPHDPKGTGDVAYGLAFGIYYLFFHYRRYNGLSTP